MSLMHSGAMRIGMPWKTMSMFWVRIPAAKQNQQFQPAYEILALWSQASHWAINPGSQKPSP
jgi:hypothetical protein